MIDCSLLMLEELFKITPFILVLCFAFDFVGSLLFRK